MPLCRKLLCGSRSLVQKLEDAVHTAALYQVHPLNRGYADELWQDKEGKRVAHKQAARYYQQLFDGEGISLQELMLGAEHLYRADEYQAMADWILNFSKSLIKQGYWSESIYLYTLILKQAAYLNQKDIGTTCNNIGGIYSRKGEWDKALEHYLKAEKIRIEMGDRAGLVYTDFNIGTFYLAKNKSVEGESCLILAGFLAVSLGMSMSLIKWPGHSTRSWNGWGRRSVCDGGWN